MAVTVADVALDLRLVTQAEEDLDAGLSAMLARHLGAAAAIVEQRAPGAPEALADAATIAIAAYLFDRPSAPSGSRFANAWTNSGASSMLARYVRRRARSVGAGGASAAPSGGSGVDAVARELGRDALAAAQAAARDAGAADGKADANAASIVRVDGEVQANAAAAAAAERLATANQQYISTVDGAVRRVGDVQSVTVATAAEFAAALVAQLASARPLWLVAAAAFAGQVSGAAFPVARGEVYWFAPGSQSPEALFTIPQGGGSADLSGYRTAAAQDIIDGRATAGINLARQEARTADGKAVVAQELVPREAALRTAADVALGLRIDALAGFAAPVINPQYWVKTGAERLFIVHLDPRAVDIAGLAKVRLTVQGVNKTQASGETQDVYGFEFTAADAATISRAAGNVGADTVHADVSLLDAQDGTLQVWRGLLRVVASAPSPTPSGGSGSIPAAVARRTASDEYAIVAADIGTIVPVSDSNPAPYVELPASIGADGDRVWLFIDHLQQTSAGNGPQVRKGARDAASVLLWDMVGFNGAGFARRGLVILGDNRDRSFTATCVKTAGEWAVYRGTWQ